jgi:hypothetical protein
VKYGLCANSSPYEEVVSAMHKPYYIRCPLGGVIRSAKKELRYLDTGFFGVGLPHWGVEAIVASTNNLMTHFGTNTLVGVQYQASAELLANELRKGPQPLCLDYDQYHHWVTPCTLKEIWVRMHRFGFQLHLHTLPMSPPCAAEQSEHRWSLIR